MPVTTFKSLLRISVTLAACAAFASPTSALAFKLQHHKKPSVTSRSSPSSGSPPSTMGSQSTKGSQSRQSIILNSEIKRIHGKNIKYPRKLKRERIQGKVVVDILISKQGKVVAATAVSGPPELCEYVLKTVRAWRYKPFFYHGHPVEVRDQVVSVFQIQDTRKHHKHSKARHKKH